MTAFKEAQKKQDIVDRLTWNDIVNANHIDVEVDDQLVQLKGTVPNLAAKLAAERNVLMVPGVSRVENFLQIEVPPKNTGPADNEINENVVHTLRHDSRISSKKFHAETSRGIVTLTGSMNSFHEKKIAGLIVSNLKGVVDVKNRLAVKVTDPISDDFIKNSIRESLRKHILINEERVLVNVRDGEVTLSGVVPNYVIRREIIDVAMHAKGVRNIKEAISIG